MSTDQEKSLVDQWIGRLPAFTAVASIGSLLLAAAYEWGYFRFVGSHYRSLLTATDYLSNALFWLPVFLLGLFFTFSLAFGLTATIRRVSEKWVTTPSIRVNNIRRLMMRLPFVFAAVAAYLFVVDDLVSVLMLVVVMLLLLMVMFIERIRQYEDLIGYLAGAVSILIFAFAIGEINGRSATEDFAPVYRVAVDAEARNLVLLRNIERGVIVRDPVRDRIEFIKWTDIKSLSSAAVKPGGFLSRVLCKTVRLCGPVANP